VNNSGAPAVAGLHKPKKNAGAIDDYIVNIVVHVVLALVAICMLYPFLNLIAVAFSPYEEFLKNPLMVFPPKLSFDAFRYVFSSNMLWNSYYNTIFITAAGTIMSLFITITMAYPLSKGYLKGKAAISSVMVFTMLFSGGMIPNFLLVRELGMYDTLWALIIPGLLSPYNVILTTNFFRAMPPSLEEAAYIDGAGEGITLIKIYLPLSAPIISTIALFVAVAYWNSYFGAVIYIKDRLRWPLQLFLREILLAANNQALATGGNIAEMDPNSVPVTSVRYACVIVVMLPIMCFYPFLQKYFAKGVMLGAVKG